MNIYKKLRKDKGLTQDQLAKTLHVEQASVSKWENDITIPDVATLELLADFYEVSIDFLLGRENCSKLNSVIIIDREQGVEEIELTKEQTKLLRKLIEALKKD